MFHDQSFLYCIQETSHLCLLLHRHHFSSEAVSSLFSWILMIKSLLWHLYLSEFWSRSHLLIFILIEMLLSILWLLECVFDICLQIYKCSYICSKIFCEISLLIYLKNSLVFYPWFHRLKIIKLNKIHTILKIHSRVQSCILLSDYSYFHLYSSQNIIIFCDYIFSILSKSCFNRQIFSNDIVISSFFSMCYQVKNSLHSFYLFCKIRE